MFAYKSKSESLKLTACETCDEIEDCWASSSEQGFDVLLVDTSARILEPQLIAFTLSDLVVAPAMQPHEAKCIVNGINQHLGAPANLLGLINGCGYGVPEAADTRAAFGYHAVLQSELPRTEALADQLINGDVADFASSLACKSNSPGFSRFRKARAAWAAVQKLSFEVEWALEGFRLEPVVHDETPFAYKRVAIA